MRENFYPLISPWILPAVTLVLTGFLVKSVRLLIRRLARLGVFKRLAVIEEVIPSVANLIYIVGLKIFIETAPLHPKVLAWLDGSLYVLAVLIGLTLLRRATLVVVEWSASRARDSVTLNQGFIPLLKNVVTLFLFFVGAIMTLKHFDYDVMSLVTALGVSSLAIGLAAKDTLSNMISGFMLIIDRNLSPGDIVNLSGSTGEVEEIGLRSTRIRTFNGNTWIVPNSELVNTKILNMSVPLRTVACSVSFKIPYGFSVEKVREVSLKIISQMETAAKGKDNWVNLASVSEGALSVTAGFWVKDLSLEGAAVSEFNEKLLVGLAREKIPLYVAPQIVSPAAL